MSLQSTTRFTGSIHQARRDASKAKLQVFAETIDLASVAAGTIAEEALTVDGVKAGAIVLAVVPPASLGLSVAYARATADDEVTVGFSNPTSGAVDPASGDFQFVVLQG